MFLQGVQSRDFLYIEDFIKLIKKNFIIKKTPQKAFIMLVAENLSR